MVVARSWAPNPYRSSPLPGLAAASVWLSQCSSAVHKHCPPSPSPPDWITPRLIEIYTDHRGTILHLKFRDDFNPMSLPRYLTLSHRWGKIKSLLLEEKSAAFQQDIDLQTLPANFVDAVLFCQKLGADVCMRIDSLCTSKAGTFSNTKFLLTD
jgi:hypothetical protein